MLKHTIYNTYFTATLHYCTWEKLRQCGATAFNQLHTTLDLFGSSLGSSPGYNFEILWL